MPDPFRRFAARSLPEWQEFFRSSTHPDDRYLALQAIVELSSPDDAVGWLIHALDDSDSGIRAGAVRRLAQWAANTSRPGSQDDWTAIQLRWKVLLTDDDPDVRYEAARGLFHCDPRNAEAVTVLTNFLTDPDTQPIMLANLLKTLSGGLKELSTHGIPWNRLLLHPQPEVREQAIRAVATFNPESPERETLLIALLDDEEPFVREEAAWALGELGTRTDAVRMALEVATRDEDSQVAQAARQALRRLDQSSG